MGLFNWLRRIGGTQPFCTSCAAKDNEIVYLRQHVDSLMDRLLCTVNLFQAQKDALEVPIVEENTPPPPESETEAIAREETEQENLLIAAQKEVDRFTDEVGAPRGSLADV